MIRGTTPTLIFTLPNDASIYPKVEIYISQRGSLIATKTKDDCTIDGNKIMCMLRQSDTLALTEEQYAYVQIRIVTEFNEVLASIPEKIKVEKLLGDGEI